MFLHCIRNLNSVDKAKYNKKVNKKKHLKLQGKI